MSAITRMHRKVPKINRNSPTSVWSTGTYVRAKHGELPTRRSRRGVTP